MAASLSYCLDVSSRWVLRQQARYRPIQWPVPDPVTTPGEAALPCPDDTCSHLGPPPGPTSSPPTTAAVHQELRCRLSEGVQPQGHAVWVMQKTVHCSFEFTKIILMPGPKSHGDEVSSITHEWALELGS